MNEYEKYMKIALNEAEKSYRNNEVPIGAVIVKCGKVISKGHNQKESKHSSLKHAELIAIEKANKKLKNWRLDDCQIYVTLKPCPMCASAIKQSRLSMVICGAKNKNREEDNVTNQIFSITDVNKTIQVVEKICEKECIALLQRFFEEKRQKNVEKH